MYHWSEQDERKGIACTYNMLRIKGSWGQSLKPGHLHHDLRFKVCCRRVCGKKCKSRKLEKGIVKYHFLSIKWWWELWTPNGCTYQCWSYRVWPSKEPTMKKEKAHSSPPQTADWLATNRFWEIGANMILLGTHSSAH